MNAEQHAKIRAGLKDCLEHLRGSKVPYTRLKKYIAALKTNPAWTATEIIELQTQVIRALLAQQRNALGDG